MCFSFSFVLFLSQFYDCRNHVRVIQPMGDGSRLYVCGTNAHNPKDWVINVSCTLHSYLLSALRQLFTRTTLVRPLYFCIVVVVIFYCRSNPPSPPPPFLSHYIVRVASIERLFRVYGNG